jgi:hypothetical protein
MRLISALMLASACGPVQVEAPDLVKGMKELSTKLDNNGPPKYFVDELAATQEHRKALEATNQDLATQLERARADMKAPYELEIECEAAPGSQSEITTSIDGVRASSVGCPARSGRITLRQWMPGTSRLHVELHVGNDSAGYNSFTVRLWHGTENAWTIARGNPMTKSEGCKAAPDHRVECAFDDPFPIEPAHAKIRTIDRQP